MELDRALRFPKLRWPLDLQIHEIEGAKTLIVTCPIGMSPQPLGLNAVVVPLLREFRGELSLDELLQRFQPQGCTSELLSELVQLLDQALFLDSPRYAAALERFKSEFRSETQRQPYLAGLSYPIGAADLTNQIDSFLGFNTAQQRADRSENLCGLISPHIDYRRGGKCYGTTWRNLCGAKHNLYLLLGTAHQYSDWMFHLTYKDFLTPLGVLKTDQDFVRNIAKQYGPIRSFADELLHRREHSLELQTPFLQRVTQAAQIVPILIGSFHEMLISGKAPQTFELYEEFLNALTLVITQRLALGDRICVISGVDMAHVGQQFGDSEPLTPEFMQEIECRDRAYLKTIVEHDKAALWQHLAEDSDRRRICGFPTLYTVLDLFDRLSLRYEAVLYDYHQAVDYQTQCAVTFAGMGMYQRAHPET